MINLRFTFVKIIVIQPSGCKGNFNKTIYLSIYLSIFQIGTLNPHRHQRALFIQLIYSIS